MFSRFTEKAIQTIMIAQEEAKRFRHGYVGTEHILLGILSIPENAAIKALKEMGYSEQQLRNLIEEKMEYGHTGADLGNIPFTQQAKQILNYAWEEARQLGHNYVNVEHLFLALFRDHSGIAAKVFNELGISLIKTKEILFKLLGEKVAPQPKTSASPSVPTPTLDVYGRDLTWLASENKLDPVVGRVKEIERICQILSRRTKNNPVLTGEAGVGKTAIVEGLAQIINKGQVPESLQGKRVFTLDLGLLVAGTKYRGEFEDRVKKIVEEVKKARNIILFIDELHTIIGTGGSEGSLDAANMFKPALARGELQCIGATTLDEYRKHIEGDAALERRFQSVLIEEPSIEETIEILGGIRSRYEEYHRVEITDQALDDASRLSQRYITERHLPDKAVDLIDEAASKIMLKASRLPQALAKLQVEYVQARIEYLSCQRKIKQAQKTINELVQIIETVVSEKTEAPKAEQVAFLEEKLKLSKGLYDEELKKQDAQVRELPTNVLERQVDSDAIADVVSQWTGVPVVQLTEADEQRLLKMADAVRERVIGQDDAIKALVRAVKRAKVGLKDPRRPTGSFLFLGPSGVGKSELAKTLAKFLFGKEDALVRIDMSEYMEKHTVSRLIGSPPGYVGYDEGGQLTEPVRRRPYSVVLFDELEKASPDVTNVLLQILEDGRLTDATGRQVNFKNTLVIMTSNVGAKLIEKSTRFGFVSADNIEDASYESMKTKLQEELRKEFRPEFLNRIDDIVVFRALNKVDIKQIVDIMLLDLNTRLAERKMSVHLDDSAKEYLVLKGYDEKHGARPLRRAIQQYIEDALADLILTHQISEDGDVFVTHKNEADATLTFANKAFKNNSKKSKEKEREKELVETL